MAKWYLLQVELLEDGNVVSYDADEIVPVGMYTEHGRRYVVFFKR